MQRTARPRARCRHQTNRVRLCRRELWQPLGAEADATWIIDATEQEVAFGFVNAVLRDYARLGLMLARRGSWQGRSIVSEDWLAASARRGAD